MVIYCRLQSCAIVEKRGLRPKLDYQRARLESQRPALSSRGKGLSSRGPGLSSRSPGMISRGRGLSCRGPGENFRGRGLSCRQPGLTSRGRGLNLRGPGLSSKVPGLSSRGRWQANTKCQSAITSAGENPRPQHYATKPHHSSGSKNTDPTTQTAERHDISISMRPRTCEFRCLQTLKPSEVASVRESPDLGMKPTKVSGINQGMKVRRKA